MAAFDGSLSSIFRHLMPFGKNPSQRYNIEDASGGEKWASREMRSRRRIKLPGGDGWRTIRGGDF
jgi:hypothetical protein